MKDLFHVGNRPGELTSFQLVRLGRYNNRNKAIVYHPVKHQNIVIGRVMANINQKEHRLQRLARMEVVLNHGSPLCLHLHTGRRIAIARKIHQIQLIIDVVIVDGLRLAWL